MKKKNLIVFGAGGHFTSCLDVIMSTKKYKILFVIDKKNITKKHGFKILNIRFNYKKLLKKCKNAFVAIGHIKNNTSRKKIINDLMKNGFNLPTIISPLAHVSKYAKIGQGNIIMHGSIINAGSKIGQNNIINSKALIEHDVEIGDHCHISTGAIINGNCKIGNDTFVGSRSVIKHGINIKNGCLIGMGAIIKNNINKSKIIKNWKK